MKQFIPTLKLKPRFLILILWLGLALIIAALSVGLVTAKWNALPLGLLISGVVFLGVWLLLKWQIAARNASSWWRRRSIQSGTNAIIATLAVVVILGVINFFGVRYSTQVDLTEAQQFSLAPQSKEVLKSLNQPVKVLIFDTSPDPQNRTLLERYQRLNPDIFDFEFIDPQAEPGLARKYDVNAIGEVVLESGDRTKKLDAGLTEISLTPAISNLVSDRQVTAYFVQGHGEIPLTGDQESLIGVKAALEQEGTMVQTLNLSTLKQFPQDANLLVIAGPRQPFLAAEIQQLETYLAEGGRVLFLLGPEIEQPRLNEFLTQWGIEVDPRFVIDGASSRPAVPLVIQYGDHPITRNFSRRLSFYPTAQAIRVEEEAELESAPPPEEQKENDKPEPQVTELLLSGELSWAETDPEGETLQPDPPQDLQGPLTLGVAISQDLDPSTPKPEQEENNEAEAEAKSPTKQARMVVIGDADFARTVYFEQELNADVLLNSINWLSSDETDPALSIRPKEPTNRRLDLNTQQGRLVVFLGLGLLPLGAFGIAAGLWWQRR